MYNLIFIIFIKILFFYFWNVYLFEKEWKFLMLGWNHIKIGRNSIMMDSNLIMTGCNHIIIWEETS